MHDSQRYRAIAGECLLAARECQPCYRKLHLSMATSWLSLARQDDIGLCKIDHLIEIVIEAVEHLARPKRSWRKRSA